MKNNVIRLRCTDNFKNKIDILAKKEGRTTSNYITNILEKEIEKMNNTLIKAKAMDKYNNNLPELEIGDTITLGDVWDGEGEEPAESYSYKLTDSDWINYEFEILEAKEDVLESLVKITNIELL